MTISDRLLSHIDYLNTLESGTEVATLEKLVQLSRAIGLDQHMQLTSDFEASNAFFSRVLNSEPQALSASDLELLKVISKFAQNRIDHLDNIRKLRKSDRIFRLTFEQIGSGVCQTDLDGYILEANDKFFDIIGYTFEEVRGLRIKDLTHPEDWEIDAVYKQQLFQYEIPYFSMQKRYFRKDGTMIWVYTTVALMRGDALEQDFLIGVVQDISSQKAAEELTKHHHDTLEQRIQERTLELNLLNARLIEANHTKDLVIAELNEVKEKLLLTSSIDPLTGLYNRRFMMACILDEINRYKRNNTPFCIILADLDFFKEINDRLGHDGGDEVLQTVSRLMTAEIRNIDTLSRWGGEEFLILLPETSIDFAHNVAHRIRKRLEHYLFSYDNFSFGLTMTLGVAVFEDDLSIKEFVKKADSALYKGKLSGRNCVV